ncbi:MAG TPA: pyrimidine dimer DNA glycosylase/endonuclease V [Anaerolineaceae bacterium]
MHPKYLDAKGLVALWREALLAQAVLRGRTRGYRSHPQLTRFRGQPEPTSAIGAFLQEVALEGQRRGYHFDKARIAVPDGSISIAATRGQLEYERQLLLTKLARRDPVRMEQLRVDRAPEPNPVFFLVEGPIEAWEIVRTAGAANSGSPSPGHLKSN